MFQRNLQPPSSQYVMMGASIHVYWMTLLHNAECWNLCSSNIADTTSIRYSTGINKVASAPKHHTMKAKTWHEGIALCLSTRWRCGHAHTWHFAGQKRYTYAQEICCHKRHWIANILFYLSLPCGEIFDLSHSRKEIFSHTSYANVIH